MIGELHQNSSQFAIACEEGGANAVMLHINHDSNPGNRFGGIELEEDAIKQCLSILKIPAGIMIGDSKILTTDDWEKCVKLGFSFVSMFAHDMPTFVWGDARVSKLLSIGPGYILEQVKALSELKDVSGIATSLTPQQGLGLPMTVLDIVTFGIITRMSAKPVFYTTQRMMNGKDVTELRANRCSGLLVTKVTYGETIDTCKSEVAKLKELSGNNPPQNPQSFTNIA